MDAHEHMYVCIYKTIYACMHKTRVNISFLLIILLKKSFVRLLEIFYIDFMKYLSIQYSDVLFIRLSEKQVTTSIHS